jgi:hypothetical protein
VVVVVNLDPYTTQAGAVDVPGDLGLPEPFTVTDALSGRAWGWSPGRNYVRLEPGQSHVFGVSA